MLVYQWRLQRLLTHGFPPHPGPTSIATISMPIGKTLLYDTILAIPTVIRRSGYARVLKVSMIPEGLAAARKPSEEGEMPSFGVSV